MDLLTPQKPKSLVGWGGSKPQSRNFRRPKEANPQTINWPDSPPKYLTLHDVRISDKEVMPGEEQGFSEFERMKLIKEDKRNENSIEACREMLREATLAIKNWEIFREAYYPEMSKKSKRVPKKVVPADVIYSILNELFPIKYDEKGEPQRIYDYSHQDSAIFKIIYDGVNGFQEPPNFDMEKVKKTLEDRTISSKRRKFLTDVRILSELSQRTKISDNQVLWKKEIQKEFEKKQHGAVLAMHFLRLKDYYEGKNYEKFAERLMKEKDSNRDCEMVNDQLIISNDDFLKRKGPSKFTKELQELLNEGLTEEFIKKQSVNETEELWKRKLEKRNYPQEPTVGLTKEIDQMFPGMGYQIEEVKFKKYPLLSFEQLDEQANNNALVERNLKVIFNFLEGVNCIERSEQGGNVDELR